MKVFLWAVIIVTAAVVLWRVVIPWLRVRLVMIGTRKLLRKIQKDHPEDENLKEGIRLITKYLKEDKLLDPED